MPTCATYTLPPENLLQIVPGDFCEIGQRFLAYFVEAGLRPEYAVLDIGCGPGRMAFPLVEYLSETGRYEGFDVMAESVDWCRQNLCDPRFRFAHADLYNTTYRHEGGGQAAAYRFPHPDGAFDFAFAVSVFTHLQGSECRQYLREVRRVLRPEGTLFATWFLGAEAPPGGIAHQECEVTDAYLEAGLSLREVAYGSWDGQPTPKDYQDIVIARCG